MRQIETETFVLEWCKKPGNMLYFALYLKTKHGLLFKRDFYRKRKA